MSSHAFSQTEPHKRDAGETEFVEDESNKWEPEFETFLQNIYPQSTLLCLRHQKFQNCSWNIYLHNLLICRFYFRCGCTRNLCQINRTLGFSHLGLLVVQDI